MSDVTPLATEHVTQEDREAAASLVRWQRESTARAMDDGHGVSQFFVPDFSRAIMQGIWDEHPVVQAFARHRIAAASAPGSQGVPSMFVPPGFMLTRHAHGWTLRHRTDPARDYFVHCAQFALPQQGFDAATVERSRPGKIDPCEYCFGVTRHDADCRALATEPHRHGGKGA